MTTALGVKNINKKYKNKVVLNDINFSIQSGEIVALIGKNGAGKSTLINIITKLIQQDSGQSKIFEKEKFDRNLIGVMMQENISLDRITVKEIIKLTRTYYRNPMSYQAILALSELQNYTNHPMDKLSGGQKRKLQFALTLAGNSDLIFLDEPTVGMDAESRTKFWERIDELKKQGKTFLITSHYLEAPPSKLRAGQPRRRQLLQPMQASLSTAYLAFSVPNSALSSGLRFLRAQG